VLVAISALSPSQQPARSSDVQIASERTAPGTLRQIIPGHYVFSSTTYNSGIIVTSDGVVVLDALNSEALDADVFVPGHGPIPADPKLKADPHVKGLEHDAR
jgi:hypothetical protein